MSNFGANFRKAREAAGLPLEKIAAETRISTRFLTAIENEAFQLLPGGIFNRGFIKAYAEYLGLDPDQALADYDRMSSTLQEPVEVLRDTDQATARGLDWSLYPIAAAILLILMAMYYFVTRKPAAEQNTPVPAVASLEQPEAVSVLPATPQPATSTEAATTTAPATIPATALTMAPATAPATALTMAPATAPATAPTTARAPSPAPIAVASALAVDVNVTDSTWIKVTTDGTVALSELLQAGTARHFSADRSIDVVIGNAAGATMQVNGRDLGQLGTSGRVREFRITPENAAQVR